MSGCCRGTCEKYRVKIDVSLGLYKNGAKRCTRCQIYVKWEGVRCPCCGYMLRSRPRAKKYKSKLREEERGEEIINVM